MSSNQMPTQRQIRYGELIRSIIKDVVYRSATVISSPIKGIANLSDFMSNHFNLYSNYDDYRRLSSFNR